MHVDGITAIISIAKLVGLPLGEVIACFGDLAETGLVDLWVAGQRVGGDEDVGASGVIVTLDREPTSE
jgi:hypothetical protein